MEELRKALYALLSENGMTTTVRALAAALKDFGYTTMEERALSDAIQDVAAECDNAPAVIFVRGERLGAKVGSSLTASS